MTNKIQKIRQEVERLKSNLIHGACSSQVAMENRCKEEAYNEVLAILDTMQEEPVSEDLEEASKEWLKPQLDKSYANYGEVKMMELTHFDGYAMLDAIEFGAKWQKEHLWKPDDGDNLPEIDREVIVLTQPYPNDEHLKVVFAHRPNNKYAKVWNSDLGEEQVIELEWFGKGEWNIPFVKYWLDAKLPYEIKENKV